jgi:hypothetical protein
MSILDKRYPEMNIRKTFKILHFLSYPLELVGSAGLASQIYPGDFDFVTKIDTAKTNKQNIFIEFFRILYDISKEHNLYFIEFKFQYKDGTKHKIHSIDEFDEEMFNKYFNNNIDYCKIDLIINILNTSQFYEVSCIYFFKSDDKELSVGDYKNSLLKDMKEFKKEGNYYKYLKRLFILAKLSNNNKQLLLLTNLFNSDVGKLYLIKSQLEASSILMDTYKDKPNYKQIQQRVKIFLSSINLKDLKLSDIKSITSEYMKLINTEAEKFINENKNNLKINEKNLTI